MLMPPFSTILVVKGMIVSFRKTGYSGMHTIMRFFSPALEEALIPTNLRNIGMAFALYLINKNPMTSCQQLSDISFARTPSFISPPRPESPTTRKSYVTGDLLEKQRSPFPLDNKLNVPAKNPGQWLSGHHALQRSRRSLRLAGDEKPTRGA